MINSVDLLQSDSDNFDQTSLNFMLSTKLFRIFDKYSKCLFIKDSHKSDDGVSYGINCKEDDNFIILTATYSNQILVKKINCLNVGTIIDVIDVKIYFPEVYCKDILDNKKINSDELVNFKMQLKFYQNKIKILDFKCVLNDFLVYN